MVHRIMCHNSSRFVVVISTRIQVSVESWNVTL